jgi:hypothetical protein
MMSDPITTLTVNYLNLLDLCVYLAQAERDADTQIMKADETNAWNPAFDEAIKRREAAIRDILAFLEEYAPELLK